MSQHLLLIDSWWWYCLLSNYLYLVTIWTLNVSWHVCFAIPRSTSWIPLYYVFFMIKQMYYLQCIIAHCQLFVLLFMCNIVAKFSLVQITFIMPLLKCFDLSLQCFYLWLIKFLLATCDVYYTLLFLYTMLGLQAKRFVGQQFFPSSE